jgi:hypothetical protein
VRFVAAGEDRFDEHHGLGISEINFKVCSPESSGLFLLENTFHARGGPARHLHFDQDEWFFAVEGVSHVWAHVGAGRGRVLVAFTPAGQMEAFFRATLTANAMPPQDPAVWRAHGMQLLGPPLVI